MNQIIAIIFNLLFVLTACNFNNNGQNLANGFPEGQKTRPPADDGQIDEGLPGSNDETDSNYGGGGGGSGGGSDVSGLSLAPQISVVTPVEEEDEEGGLSIRTAGSRIHRLFSALSNDVGITAFDDSDTDYSTDEQHFWVYLDALEPLEMANMIMCFTKQLGYSDASTLNQGNYIALVDMSQCEQGQSTDTSGETGQSSNTQSVQYERVVVNSTRESGSSPQVVRVWVPQAEGDSEGEIRAELTIDESATDELPFGVFTINWAHVDADSDEPIGGGTLRSFNEVDGEALPEGKVAISLYETMVRNMSEMGGPDETIRFIQAASAVMGPDGEGGVEDGVALTQKKLTTEDFDDLDGEDFGMGDFQKTFALSYNTDNMLMQSAGRYEDLPYVADDDNSSGDCLSRTEFKQAVWCYNMYDSTTGERVELETGFPFTIQKEECGEDELFGHIGYWGIWFEGQNRGIDGCAIEDGDIITKKDFRSNQEEDYTVFVAPGKLVHHIVKSLPLNAITGIDFESWELPGDFGGVSEDDPYAELRELRESGDYQVDNWIVNYLGDGFYIVGFISHTENGPSQTSLADIDGLSAAQFDVTPSEFEGQQLWMYSRQLGGSVKYVKDSDQVTYNTEEIVTGSDDLFADADDPISLHCLNRCLKAGITEENMTSFDGIYEEDPNGFGGEEGEINSLTYTIARTDMGLKNESDEAIVLADGAESSGQYFWGVNSGPMVTDAQLAALTNWWDIFDSVDAEFYTWETGTNSWNRYVSAIDESGDFADFDKPIEFSYTHATENDRSDDDTYDGQTFLIGYGGQCQLWGIPQVNVGGEGFRWYPAFSLADGTVLGEDGQYVIKAIEGEQKPQISDDGCDGLVVNDPAQPLPDDVDGEPSNIDDEMPEVTDAPKVIGGVVVAD